LAQEADQAAVMVDVAVADDQRLDIGRIGFEKSHVVDERRRGVAEVEQDCALLLSELRLQEHRQARLVVQDVATVGAAPRPRALMNNSVDRAAAQVLIMLLVNQYADRQLVDGWNLKRLPRCDLGTAESGGRSGSGDRCRTFQEISTFEIVHVGPSMLKR